MRVVARRVGIGRDFALAIAQHDLGFIMRPRRLRHSEFGVELSQAGGGVERQPAVRHLDDVQIVDLVETAGEQPAPRIGRHRLQLAAADQRDGDGDDARRCEHSRRTQPHRHRGYPRNPRGEPPGDPPASAQAPRTARDRKLPRSGDQLRRPARAPRPVRATSSMRNSSRPPIASASRSRTVTASPSWKTRP